MRNIGDSPASSIVSGAFLWSGLGVLALFRGVLGGIAALGLAALLVGLGGLVVIRASIIGDIESGALEDQARAA